MQVKTIKKIISKKMTDWLGSITNETLRNDVKKNILVSGGCITSLFQGLPVNDYDVYIQDMDVLVRLGQYYYPGTNFLGIPRVLDGRKREEYLNSIQSSYSIKENDSEEAIRYKTLKPDQVKLNINSVGMKKDLIESKKYQVAFFSQNAISLTEDIQIVLRFNGNATQIHKTFDFVHATNYFTFEEGLVTNVAALESILTKSLRYQGSLYPLTSVIRMKKFIQRGWTVNAGEILKMLFQVSELDLKNIEVLEDQLIGVDVAYFSLLITVLRDTKGEMSAHHLSELIDKVFNEYEEPADEEIK
jgi:hypothetical protein